MEDALHVEVLAAARSGSNAVANPRPVKPAAELSMDEVQEILREASQAGSSARATLQDMAEVKERVAQVTKEQEGVDAYVKTTLSMTEDLDRQWADFKKKFDELFELGAKKLAGNMPDTKPRRPAELVDEARVAQVLRRSSRLVVLTGAGVSAESGIPTFRGADGYWTVGSENYRPQELATWEKFNEMPEELWRWYQYRWGVCRKAAPNPGHYALVELDGLFDGTFLLVTQNIDGLHKQAGSNPARLCEIHGRIDQMRCDENMPGACLHGLDLNSPENFAAADAAIQPMPEPAKEEQLEKLPTCAKCGVRQRPKILWFDESYNEAIFRSKTALAAVEGCDVLLILGTQLTTGLPSRMVGAALRGGAIVVRMDPHFDPEESAGMLHLQAKSGEALPRILVELRQLQKEPPLAPVATSPAAVSVRVASPAPSASGGASQVPSAKAAPKATPKAVARRASPSRGSSPAGAPSAARRSPSSSLAARPSSGAALRAAASVTMAGGGGRPQAAGTGPQRPSRPSVASATEGAAPEAARRGARMPSRTSAAAPADGPVAAFFVYGTLRPDDDSGASWTKSFCEDMSAEAAMLPGASMYYRGDYPAVCFEQTRCSVRGVLLTPAAGETASALMEAKLAEADRIEAYPSLYDRAVATVVTAIGVPQRAYVYHRTGRFERTLSARIPDGDWMSRHALTKSTQ